MRLRLRRAERGVIIRPSTGGPHLGTLYCGDCLEVLEKKVEPESVDLIYADPPFFSNRNYEVIWGDEAEIRSFRDRWEGGIEVYAAWMAERLRACHRVLKKTGSIYLHCDWHASHYLKVRMDEIFGAGNFQNEIIWYYKGAGVSPKRWARRHDTILWYSKSDRFHFDPDPVRDEYADSTKERFSHYIGNVRGGHDFGVQELNPKGKHPDDVWQIKIIAPSANERLGYPTQKPEPLLERIVKSSSKKGALVLDPFCGCGTSVTIAQKLSRAWIGIDISPTAVRVINDRVTKAGAGKVEMLGLPSTIDEIKKLEPFEFQNWVVRERFNGTLGKKGGDMGIDGYTFMVHQPIQVKQSEHVGRNVVDNFVAAMKRSRKKKGYIVAFSFGKGAYEEAAAVKRREEIEIVLLRVEDILSRPPE